MLPFYTVAPTGKRSGGTVRKFVLGQDIDLWFFKDFFVGNTPLQGKQKGR